MTYCSIQPRKDDLVHYGIKRRSGRYPWGSGKRPHQHDSGRALTKKAAEKHRAKVIEMGLKGTSSSLRKCGSVFLNDKDNEWQQMTAEMIDGKVQLYPPAQTISWYKENMDGQNPYPKNYEDNNTLRFAGGSLSIVDMKRTNPKLKEENGYSKNCTKCAATMEMRARGYDVSAGRALSGVDSNCYSYWFNGAHRDLVNVEDVDSVLRDYGAGARGVIDFRNKGGGGHEVFWCVDENNQIAYLDGQIVDGSYGTGNVTRDYMSRWSFDATKPAGVVRLDNTEPNFDAMAEDSVFTDVYRSHGRNYDDILEDKTTGYRDDDYRYKIENELRKPNKNSYYDLSEFETKDPLYSNEYYYNRRGDYYDSDRLVDPRHYGSYRVNKRLERSQKRKGR